MSKKNKLQKFADLLTFPNVYENFEPGTPDLVHSEDEDVQMAGLWNQKHFKNNNKITLELACGGGEYTVALARMFPDRNFIGVDIKGARIWKGARVAVNENLSNAAFLRTRIEYIKLYFEKGEVDEIWITFPDPFLRDSKVNRRLTSPYFLGQYRNILKENGLIHLKTDSPELYDFTVNESIPEVDFVELLVHDSDIYAKERIMPELEIKTFYEQKHLENGLTIKYVRFVMK